MMKKIKLILTLVAFILLLFLIFHGIKIGNLEILSVSQIIEKDNLLNAKISEASSLTTIDYPNSIKKMEDNYDNYKIEKQKYEELVGYSSEESKEIYETKQYDIGYLWKILGDYAKSRNLTISMDVARKTGNLYDLNFDISGTYANISKFIDELEDNSDLYFRIYNFKMSGDGVIISSSFTVKNVNIDPSTITWTGIIEKE